MTDKPVFHPDKDELVAFGLGKLEPAEATRIETHLGECKTCCETLLDLKDDTFVELVRNSPEPNQATEDAKDFVRSELTEPVGGIETDDSITAETMLVDSGVSRGPADLPAQLEDHPRYRINELIGKGGMGVVYKAQHRLMDRLVALKLINQDLVKNTQAVDRFRREVRAAASLTHPNIVTAYDAEQAGDVHFLVMEFVDGTDLSSFVQQQGPLPIARACDCIWQTAEGLQHAHEKGMVHRDIKPHNLMLSESGQVRILDFGLAGFAAEFALLEAETDPDKREQRPVSPFLTTIGSVMGTPDYIAPEQARDAHSADIRADIYSLGCTLFYLLTGEPPFTTNSVVDKLKAHEEQEPPALQGLRDDVPAELADIVTRMMAKNPDERFQTPADVATALSPFANALRSGSVTAQRSKRKKLFAIATALFVPLVLVAGIVIYLATDTGQIEIDASGIKLPDARIVLLKNGKEYARFNLESDEKLQTIRAAEYEVQLQGVGDDVQMEVWSKRRNSNNWGEPGDHENEPIVLYRGGGMLVRVTRRQSLVASVTDQDRLQGKWVPVSGHIRTKAMTDEQLANMSVTFEGDRVTLTDPNGGGQIPSGTFTFDEERTPKHVTLSAPDSSETLPGIFQFDGDRVKLAWIDEDYARPTDFEPSDKPDHMTAILERAPLAGPRLGETERDVLKAADEFLAVMDEGNFGQLWNISASWAKRSASRGNVSQTHQTIRDAFGKAVHRTLFLAHQLDQAPHLPNGRYAGVQYKTRFERQEVLWETLLLNIDTDGKWRVNSYQWTLDQPTLPREKDDKWRVSGYFHEPGTPATPPRTTGILTSPPSVPPGGLQVGRNLIIDSSLENTPVGKLPRTWSAWLDDGPDFKCEVVEGGVTGKHCLRISGKGMRGVVFATSIPLDRTKRYALKGRVKLTGDANTRAVIKFNYFHSGGWLGVQDLVGVTSNEAGWQFFEKTDRADFLSEATLIVPTCHIEGNGTAWFDDLELVAYDRGELPTDFDEKHGKNNRISQD